MENENQKWKRIIKSKRKPFDLQFGEVWRYRDLIALFVKREFISKYKQTHKVNYLVCFIFLHLMIVLRASHLLHSDIQTHGFQMYLMHLHFLLYHQRIHIPLSLSHMYQ